MKKFHKLKMERQLIRSSIKNHKVVPTNKNRKKTATISKNISNNNNHRLTNKDRIYKIKLLKEI